MGFTDELLQLGKCIDGLFAPAGLGIINDHGRDCPRYAIVNAATKTIRKRRDREKGVVDFS